MILIIIFIFHQVEVVKFLTSKNSKNVNFKKNLFLKNSRFSSWTCA
jgi:hypothetical protein